MSAKISALGSLTGAGVAQTADLLPIVDVSVTQTKSILISELSLAQNVVASEVSTTSGTYVDSGSIPSWASRISVMLSGVSTNGTDGLTLELRSSGNSTGDIVSNGANANQTGTVTIYPPYVALITSSSLAASVWEAAIEITLTSEDLYAVRSCASTSNAATSLQKGSGRYVNNAPVRFALYYLRLSTTGGTNTFDAGAMSVLYS